MLSKFWYIHDPLIYSRLPLIWTPGDRRNLFVLSGIICVHLYRLGELNLVGNSHIARWAYIPIVGVITVHSCSLGQQLNTNSTLPLLGTDRTRVVTTPLRRATQLVLTRAPQPPHTRTTTRRLLVQTRDICTGTLATKVDSNNNNNNNNNNNSNSNNNKISLLIIAPQLSLILLRNSSRRYRIGLWRLISALLNTMFKHTPDNNTV